MILALVAVVLAIGAGAVVAVSAREPAVAAIGLAVALVAAALATDPLPSPAVLGVRVVAALLVATLIRWVTHGQRVRPSPLGWPAEALLATAGGVAGLGIAIGLAAAAVTGPGALAGQPDGGAGPGRGVEQVVTAMALTVAAGASLLTLGAAAMLRGAPGGRRAIGLVLVTQAVLLVRLGIAGPSVELEEVARAALLVVVGATGAALARAAGMGGDEEREAPAAGGRRPATAR